MNEGRPRGAGVAPEVGDGEEAQSVPKLPVVGVCAVPPGYQTVVSRHVLSLSWKVSLSLFHHCYYFNQSLFPYF